jgi:clan AA aspartic protease
MMGLVHTEITLINTRDVFKAEDGLIPIQEIRQATIKAMVDTGASTLIINEDLRCQLGLKVKAERQITLANDTKEKCQLTEPVEIRWKDRETTCRALVIPGAGEVLLGAIPLEDMDLIVDPKKQELIGAHGDDVVLMAK